MLESIDHIFRVKRVVRHADQAISVEREIKAEIGSFGVLVKEEEYEKSAYDFEWS